MEHLLRDLPGRIGCGKRCGAGKPVIGLGERGPGRRSKDGGCARPQHLAYLTIAVAARSSDAAGKTDWNVDCDHGGCGRMSQNVLEAPRQKSLLMQGRFNPSQDADPPAPASVNACNNSHGAGWPGKAASGASAGSAAAQTS